MISIDQWRAVVGCFVPRTRRVPTPLTTMNFYELNRRLNHRHGVCLFVVISLLLMCGDVESNPGPKMTAVKTRQTTLSADGSLHEPSQEPTMTDIMDAITGLNKKFDIMSIETRDMNNVLSKQQDILQSLQRENGLLREETKKVNGKLIELELKLDDLENRSRRNNLVFHGISANGNETWEETECHIKNIIKDKLSVVRDIPIERAHRVGSRGSSSPIVVKFASFKDRSEVLSKRSALRNTSIYINEDFSVRIRDVRRKLGRFLKAAREEGKRASMVFDHLIIDGTRFDWDEETQDVKPAHRSYAGAAAAAPRGGLPSSTSAPSSQSPSTSRDHDS